MLKNSIINDFTIHLTFITTSQILNSLYPGTVTLVPQVANKIIVPIPPIIIKYNAGTVVFGGNPSLQFSYAGNVDTAVNFGGIGLDGSVDKLTFQSMSQSALALSNFVNQPFVANFSDASATYGRILASHLTNGGTNWSPGDTSAVNVNEHSPILTVLTVAPITGAILTYSLDAGAGIVGGPYSLDFPSAGGVGGSITVDTTSEGNGTLQIDFDYELR